MADGATGAPETGAGGADGTAGGATVGGRRSEPYAGNGPTGAAGAPVTGAVGADHVPPVITAGGPAAVPPPVGGVGAADAGGGASTGAFVAINAPALGTVGATGGVPGGGPACAGGGVAPDSIAWIVPDDNDCAPAPAGWPATMPLVNDWPSPGERPCPPTPAGDTGPPGAAGIPGDIDPPPPGICRPPPGGGVGPGAGGTGPPAERQPAPTTAGAGGCAPGFWTAPALPLDPPCAASPKTIVATGGAFTSPAAPARSSPPNAEFRSSALIGRGP